MDKQKTDNLIAHLMAIENYSKDIHYNCSGTNFYGNHLFADRCAEGLSDYIDQLKEICLLGHGFKPLHSNALTVIESINGTSKGDENLLGAIAQDIQNNVGLINIMERV